MNVFVGRPRRPPELRARAPHALEQDVEIGLKGSGDGSLDFGSWKNVAAEFLPRMTGTVLF